jgi:hypothetical protein
MEIPKIYQIYQNFTFLPKSGNLPNFTIFIFDRFFFYHFLPLQNLPFLFLIKILFYHFLPFPYLPTVSKYGFTIFTNCFQIGSYFFRIFIFDRLSNFGKNVRLSR